MIVYLIFSVMALAMIAYYGVFEYSRYKMAKTLAEALGGRAVFRLGKSHMRREHRGVEERAAITPDDKMEGAELPSFLRPSSAMMCLHRRENPGFRFRIEPKTGILFRSFSLDRLKTVDFNVPRLDEHLRLRVSDRNAAGTYFHAEERSQAVSALFRAGFNRLEGGPSGIAATMKGPSADDLRAERIDSYLKQLRNL